MKIIFPEADDRFIADRLIGEFSPVVTDTSNQFARAASVHAAGGGKI